MLGRRRIGKSTLIEEFARQFPSFIAIQGLAPEIHSSNQDQLDHFATRMSIIFDTRKEHFEDWSEAFHALAAKAKRGEHLILLDEISWMGKKDPLFAAKLKDAWDLEFRKNPKLILVVCGSVSKWIDENILKNMNFEGRISLEINLGELSLREINQFWTTKNYHMGSMEKMTVLSVTGGVPKYLEEVLSGKTAEQNLISMCFTPSGILFNEYEKIFSDIFERKKKGLARIVRTALNQKLTPQQLAAKLGVSQSGDLTENLHILDISGFISRDYYFKPDGQMSKLGHIRVKDNYLQFYLNQIAPSKDRILHGGKTIRSLSDLKTFESILGYQFENLILGNRTLIYPHLDLNEGAIVSSAPYVQRKTAQNKGGCQIDLLIHTNLDVFFMCEFKCKRVIDKSIIREVQKKCEILKLPSRSSLKPVLVYEGELYPPHREAIEAYFYKLIRFEDLLI